MGMEVILRSPTEKQVCLMLVCCPLSVTAGILVACSQGCNTSAFPTAFWPVSCFYCKSGFMCSYFLVR